LGVFWPQAGMPVPQNQVLASAVGDCKKSLKNSKKTLKSPQIPGKVNSLIRIPGLWLMKPRGDMS
jgi:hypothetical protein